MTPEEKRQQQEKEARDRYRFGAYHWEDNGKDDWVVPINTEYTKPQPTWWGKKDTWTNPPI